MSLSRRELLKDVSAFTVGLCFPTELNFFVPNTSEQQQLSESERAILRAASLQISFNNGRGGHGGIYQFENRFFIMTLDHVLRQVHDQMQIIVPGLRNERWNVEDSSFHPLPGRSVGIEPIYARGIREDDEFDRQLRETVASGRLIPLQEATINPEDLIIATRGNNDTLSRMRPINYNSELNVITCVGIDGEVCNGYSGQPVLKVNNGILTNQSCGFLGRASDISDAQPCANGIFVIRTHN